MCGTGTILQRNSATPMYFIRDYSGPELYQGSSDPDVLVLGQDPTIDRKTRFAKALGLGPSEASSGRGSPRLKDYLFNKVLTPLGIDNSRIIAANLVNLYYYDVPNRKITPMYRELITATAKDKGIAVEEYPDQTNGAILHALNFELVTRRDFEGLINTPSIKHLITLGEPVFQVLRERYRLDLQPKIRAVLESLNDRPPLVVIGGRQVSLLPLPHIFREKNERWQFYSRFLNEDLARLSSWYAP